ncbi:MAG: DNA primase [Planctomycetes bacterium]|nr:DNA primase [Planctomycetota bacterium]
MDRFEEAKLRVKEATDLVALIEASVPLRPRGRNLIALCPFHKEASPSFNVSRERQYFHCFGCGKSGDVFTWVQERDGVTFREAMEILADRAGISLEGVWKGHQGGAPKGPDPFEVLAEVTSFFRRELDGAAGEPARRYLESRGLVEAIDEWQLGFHSPGPAFGREAQQRRWPREVLEQAGLLRAGRGSFAGRVIFPIVDERGRHVGFGGRIIPGAPGNEGAGDDKPPKYVNSPESPFFNKRRVLFGLYHAKKAQQRRIVVMEGYTDVIACHLAGFSGAVASLGTAFTADHARVVERYATEGLVLMFDGDRAGQQAAERAMRELVNSQLPVRIALMSDTDEGGAKDPADVVTARPDEEPELVHERRARFSDVIDNAEDHLSVWFRLLRRRMDFSQAVHVDAAARECAGILALVTSPVRQAAMVEQMARHLAVPTPTLQRLLTKVRPARAQAEDEAPARRVAPARSPVERAELELLACFLGKPTLLAGEAKCADTPFTLPDVATLVAMAIEGVALGRTKADDLVKYLFARVAEEPALRSLLGESSERAAKIADPEAVAGGLAEGRRRVHAEPLRRSLRQRLEQAIRIGDGATAAALQQELLDSLRRDRSVPAPAVATRPDQPLPHTP